MIQKLQIDKIIKKLIFYHNENSKYTKRKKKRKDIVYAKNNQNKSHNDESKLDLTKIDYQLMNNIQLNLKKTNLSKKKLTEKETNFNMTIVLNNTSEQVFDENVNNSLDFSQNQFSNFYDKKIQRSNHLEFDNKLYANLELGKKVKSEKIFTIDKVILETNLKIKKKSLKKR